MSWANSLDSPGQNLPLDSDRRGLYRVDVWQYRRLQRTEVQSCSCRVVKRIELSPMVVDVLGPPEISRSPFPSSSTRKLW